jgi:hypothetical protein
MLESGLAGGFRRAFSCFNGFFRKAEDFRRFAPSRALVAAAKMAVFRHFHAKPQESMSMDFFSRKCNFDVD